MITSVDDIVKLQSMVKIAETAFLGLGEKKPEVNYNNQQRTKAFAAVLKKFGFKLISANERNSEGKKVAVLRATIHDDPQWQVEVRVHGQNVSVNGVKEKTKNGKLIRKATRSRNSTLPNKDFKGMFKYLKNQMQGVFYDIEDRTFGF